MRRSLLGTVAAGACVALAGWLLAPAGAATWGARSGTGVFQPVAGSAVPPHGGTADSLNWSGYAVAGSGITGVAGTFAVPPAGLLPPGFAATWVGIGGYSSTDLIQAGVGEQSLPGAPLLGPQYYAWYETLPQSETPITNCTGDPNCTVEPGDDVAVNIANAGGDDWKITMTDSGHWTWSTSVHYASSESSAEWILEAPTLVAAQTLVAPLGTVSFGPTSTFTAGGSTKAIQAGNPVQIDMGIGVGPNEATPSGLAPDGESFNDCTYASSCPTP